MIYYVSNAGSDSNDRTELSPLNKVGELIYHDEQNKLL